MAINILTHLTIFSRRGVLVSAATLAIVLCLSSLTSAQAPATSNTNLCSSRFEAALAPECFETYGVNFTGVIYILSGNRTGAIPAGYTYPDFLQFLCSANMQDKIVPCVLQQMQKYNSTQCTQEDRLGVLGRGGQLLAFMDALCGEACEQEATQGLIQCYTAIDVNPEPILSQNASIADDKYTIVGKNESEYDKFCNNRQKLFSCLSPLSTTCPGLLTRLYQIGIDLEAMETATGVECADKQKYFQGLDCFSKATQCDQTTAANMRTILAGRYQTGQIVPSQYMGKLCEAKITQIDCELSAYSKTCNADVTALRRTVECSILPKPCREGAKFQAAYNGICQTVTTPSPALTQRPTQGQPGKIPNAGPGPGVGSSQTNGGGDPDGAVTAGLSMILMILMAVTSIAFL